MKTLFPKKECHVPKWFLLDASGKTLGRLSTEVSKLLRGKEISFFTPGVDLGNFVIIINANKIKVTGKKETQKLYYRNSQRPGNLKIETFKELRNRIPTRILEKAIWGMLPKGVLGRTYYKRLYIYANNEILYDSKEKNLNEQNNFSKSWIKIDL
jgi:large subunit ribosomal protein L13